MIFAGQKSTLDPRLARLLGGEELAGLRRRLRNHFERSTENDARGSLQLTQLSMAEHEALALLTGRSSRFVKSRKVDLGQLDAALLAAGIAASLREALEMIDGPIINRAAEKAEVHARWAAVTEVGDRHPTLTEWLQTRAAPGLLKRLSRQDAASASQLLERANAVLRRLPAAGLTRAQLAAEVLGDAHALDNGQPTATIVLAALRHGEGMQQAAARSLVPDKANSQSDDHQLEERTRDVWARAGVLVNELARPALFLNLPVRLESASISRPGEPGYLSLRKLLRTSIDWSVDGQSVFVCENPNILSIAADHLGAACAPLVCTDGMPAAAQRALLTQLALAGARLHYHGDFDWAGLHIANHVLKTYDATPWQFERGDYLRAVESASPATHDLKNAAVVASWDSSLTEAMETCGVAIPEEAVVTALLVDLRQSSS